ncbi:MAG: monoamine oxidase [Candidatus Poriferisodalaceae bacterium]|jgi:monoamine oxidase
MTKRLRGQPDELAPAGTTPRLPDRRAFLMLGASGLAALLASCSNADTDAERDTDEIEDAGERVVVVGAGAAGMTAAHLLRQQGVDVVVLEAAPTHGGRIKHDLDFTDFPISLGAEWVHVEADILDEIVNDASVEVTTELVAYDPSDIGGYYEDGTLTLGRVGDIADLKFVNSSWLDFFNQHIVPGIEDTIVFDTKISTIDYSGDVIRLVDSTGTIHQADKAIVTAPLKVLQRGDITFVPDLPDDRTEAIDQANIWSGLKVFLEFSEGFYPTVLELPDSETADGQRLYYDAAYGQDTTTHVLGLFAVGAQAETYQALSDDDLLTRILAELDEIFDGAATRTYVRHLVQNWNEEPFARAAYLADVASPSTSTRLAGSVDGRLFFAGDSYTSFDDWGSVHSATRSAAEAVENLLR